MRERGGRAPQALPCAAPGPAGSPVDRPTDETTQLDSHVFRTLLEGGTVVVSERMETVRSVAVGLWFRQGSVHEAPEEWGISHLLEHMVFKGTARRSARDLVLAIERVGGAMDAYTGHECTAYQARVTEPHLELVVDVLCDLSFHPCLRQADLELERQVVLEELAGIEESPEEVALELHASALYGEHPYGRRVAGDPDTVSRLTREQLIRLHERAYGPQNLIVAAAGHLDHEALVRSIRDRLPRNSGPTHPAPDPPVGHPGRRCIRRPGGRQAHLVAGATTVAHTDPLRYACVLVDTALGAGMSSRLFQRIREERGLAYTVYSFASFYQVGGHAGAYVSTSPARAREAREALQEEFRVLAEAGLTEEEIRATKEQLKGQVMLALEAPAARMNRLAALELYGETYRSLDAICACIEEVSEEDIRRAARLLHPDGLAIVELVPA